MNINKKVTSKSTIDVVTNYNIDFKPVGKNEFAEFIREKRNEYNEDNGKELSTRDLGEMIGIGYEMFRKILNQEKPTKKRDCIIAICVALQLFPGEIDEALSLYQYMPALDINNPRDHFISALITYNPQITVSELNDRLIQMGFSGLDILDKRNKEKRITMSDSKLNLPYELLGIKVRTPIDSDYYYGDQYDSLATTYDPSRYMCTGDMWIYDKDTQNRIHLILSSDGYMSSQIANVDTLPILYLTLEDTGTYQSYFIELNNAVSLERQRLLSILNDTKNYQKRVSARLINNAITVFFEQFNYSLPELNEYYVLEYSKDNYSFHVYNESAFMYKYLGRSRYKDFFGDTIPRAIESYEKLNKLDQLLSNSDISSNDSIRYRMRKRVLIQMKKEVDYLYEQIRTGDVFIQNFKYIFDNPLDILHYYKIENEFNCVYDSVIGEICNASTSADFTQTNGTSITITLAEIIQAFEYGFSSIEEICKVKSILGSIDSVL